MTQDSTKEQPRNAAPPIIHMRRHVVNIDGPGQKPEKYVSNNFFVKLSQDRTRAGDLQLLQKEPLTPGKPISAPLDHHDLIQICGGHGTKPDSFPEREKATVLFLWLIRLNQTCFGFSVDHRLTEISA